MDPDPLPKELYVSLITEFGYSEIVLLSVILLLLVCSALVSGAEVAFFSLSPKHIQALKDNKSSKSKLVLGLLEQPEKLLANILISNNFINVGIVILSSFFMNTVFNFQTLPGWLTALIQVFLITFILLLTGEIIPKIYATQNPNGFSLLMAKPMRFSQRVFSPLSFLLLNSTSFIQKRFAGKKQNISINDLSQALELTADTLEEEKEMLEGVVKINNIDVKEIMKSRMDVVAIESSNNFNKVKSVIIESGYSRIPIYEESFDNIQGVLYIKDLLPYLEKDDEFDWKMVLRKAYYVPENKKINDLLEEFQSQKIHLAVVVDEYGGSSGIITLEDILEEIVGEINDEYDNEEIFYKQVADNEFVFEAKTTLHDFYKILDLDDVFEEVRGDADSLAGLILELTGEIPEKYEKINYKDFVFQVIAVDDRRIKKIKVCINQKID